jgi:hypothetical protein
LVIAVLASFSIPSPSQTSRDTAPIEDEHGAQRELHGTDKKPFSVKIIPPTKSKEDVDQEKKEREEKLLLENIKITLDKWMVEYTRRTAEYNLFIAYITGGLLLIAAFQLGMFAWQLWLTRSTTQTQLRAYMFSDYCSVGDTNNLERGKKRKPSNIVMGGVRIKNSGHTPAYDVLSFVEICVCAPTDESKLIVPAVLGNVSKNVVAPGHAITRSSTWPKKLEPSDIQAIKEGKLAIYIYGRVEYKDAFGHQRFTELRVKYHGVYPPPVDTSMTFCDEGNNAS